MSKSRGNTGGVWLSWSFGVLNFVVAMPAEAKPLIEHFRLRLIQKQYGFSLYQRGDIGLVTTGLGKVNAAVATLYAQTLMREGESAVWINLGVGGHAQLDIGTVVLASSVRDLSTGRRWAMSLPAAVSDRGREILTLDKPDFDYHYNEVIEMEASGFVATAHRFAPPNRVLCFKVIADNAAESAEKFKPAAASRLIANVMPVLDDLLMMLRAT